MPLTASNVSGNLDKWERWTIFGWCSVLRIICNGVYVCYVNVCMTVY